MRWELASGSQPDAHRAGHIPGARFVDLEHDLAAPARSGGRHPLPATEAFGAAMRRLGVEDRWPVVVYDAATGTAAARAWWLLRYFGHDDVRVLDGGLAAWIAGGEAVAQGRQAPSPPGSFTARPGRMPLLDAAAAEALVRRGGTLLDARAPERYRGESEPIDPVAGHIPGARNRPATVNVTAGGRLRPAAELRADLAAEGIDRTTEVGAYCGSGITAAHEVLALAVAGIPAALYAGSWSDWIGNPVRPVATGGC